MRVDPNDCSDAELIRAAGADAAAFGVLYERHALRVYTWSRRRLDWAASEGVYDAAGLGNGRRGRGSPVGPDGGLDRASVAA
jgi:hypothetical protein